MDETPLSPHDRDTAHSAAASALGYIYQCRLALVHALRKLATGSSFRLSIETLDDVVFDDNGDAVELLQAKHHISGAANLTDRSPELWSALRVWCEAISAGALPEDAMVYLLTTSTAPDGSAASYIGSVGRDEAAALQRLSAAATTSPLGRTARISLKREGMPASSDAEMSSVATRSTPVSGRIKNRAFNT